jgi:hypothetical protein
MATDSKAKVPTHVGKHGDHPVGGAVGAAIGAAVSKTVVRASVPEVRILSSPPFYWYKNPYDYRHALR